MCGIVGVLFFDKELTEQEEQQRKEAGLFLFTELLALTETRGKDATGVTALFDNGDYVIQKGAFTSSEFISKYNEEDQKKSFENFMNLCRENKALAKAFIGHCRKSSVGNITDNENNHPIRAGEIVGIHNGTLKNQNTIFKNLGCKRDGTVDSEAIFRLLEHFTNKCKEPFTFEILEETVSRLQGSYSCLAYNANNPFQISAFRRDRPMELCLLRNLGILIIVSEIQFFRKAVFSYNKASKLYGLNMPLITKKDVVDAMLPNDSVALIDLTTEIKEKDLIVDIVKRKSVVGLKKTWQDATYNTYGGTYNRNNYNSSTKTTNKGNQKAIGFNTGRNARKGTTTGTKTNTKKQEDLKFVGKIYCKDLDAYISESEIKETQKLPAVCIERDTNSIVELEKAVKSLTDTKKNDVSKKEVPLEEIQKIKDLATKCKKSLKRYENNQEFIEDIGAASISAVKALEPYALANRVITKAFEEGFVAGYQQASDKEVASKKEDNTTAIVATAKKVIDILSLATELNRMPKETAHAVTLSMDVPDIKVPKKVELDKLLSVGDLKNSAALQAISDNTKAD
jgi:glucosamine 6-phosphate synthetase-like amidotransferase/phosphosugar isomerase protein